MKMFRSDYPRRVVNCPWFWWYPALDALPVASALVVPFLLACRPLPVSLLRLPARPLPRRLPAALAAIALARLPGMKTLLAPFQQTPSHPRPAAIRFGSITGRQGGSGAVDDLPDVSNGQNNRPMS